ncbi:MAG: AAA family ATPase, partial [Solimonas sp.]
MYLEFFQLREMPFSITPDPAYLYMSPRHQEALGHLLYGTGQYGGFVQLTGEVGTGKTTIVRTLLEQKLDQVDVAFVHNPRLDEQEFVQAICDELRVAYPRERLTLKALIDALNEHLLRAHAEGRRTVLIIDEAQNLQPAVLEQVRLLTNLETAKEKLLRIMLIGQPELSVLLARPDLRQLASRITARFHLTPLGARETAEYIEHRLKVAAARPEIFTPAAMADIHRYTKGVPRLINIVCDRALLGAYAQNARVVTPEIVRKAAREAIGELPGEFDPHAQRRWRLIEIGWAATLLLSLGLLAWSLLHHQPSADAAGEATNGAGAPPEPAPATA